MQVVRALAYTQCCVQVIAGSVGLTIVANRLIMRAFQGTGASRREELGRGADVRGRDGSPVFQRRDSDLMVSRVPSDGEGDSDQVCHRINPLMGVCVSM